MKKTLQKIGVATLALLIAVSAVIPAVSVSAQTAQTASCYTYFRNLTVGSTGTDVIALQTFLVNRGHLVMPIGVPMGYFGGLTQAAVAKYQASKGIMPTAGYFGPLTRARVALECIATPPVVTPPTNGGGLNGGEASLEKFTLDGGDDSELEEGSSAEIAEIEFDVEDGDARINRVDLTFAPNSGNEENDPWDAFDSVRLLVDGDEIAEADLSDEDDWLDEDEPYVFRLSNINHVVKEGDTANIVVELTAQNSVDGADNNTAGWTIYVDDSGIRAEDAEGIQQYVGDEDETVTFDIDVEGAGEELKVSTSTEDPDSTTLQVEDDQKSDWHSIFAFELEGEESDIEIDTVQIVLESDVTVSNLVSDLILEIDGEEFDDWTFVGSGTSTRTIEFDIDKDFTLDADSEVTVVLMAEFKAANGTNYSSGATIQASIEDGAIDAEGADDIVSDGSANGEEHTVATRGIVVDEPGFDYVSYTKSNDDGTIGVFKFTFEVTAFEEDFYIATSSVATFLDGPGSATINTSVVATGDEDTDDVFTVQEGETETFTVTVSISNASVAGQYRVGLDSVGYTENSDGISGVITKDVVDSDFRTDFEQVN